jgi:hypothetical protein
MLGIKSNLRKGLFSFFLLFVVFLPKTFSAILAINTFPLNFQEKIDTTKGSFLDVYYDLVKNGYFSNHQHNLIIPTDIERDFQHNGVILLGLIEYLQKRDDFDSKFLLEKLNEYMCLNMHRFIAKMDTPKTLQGTMWTSFYKLYEHQIVVSGVDVSSNMTHLHPFRTTLTKTIIAIYLILQYEFTYDKQKESLVLCLEQIKNELLAINNGLGHQRLGEVYITDFIKIMETHSVIEPLVQPRSIKRILVILFAVLICIALAIVIIYKVAPNLPKSWEDFKDKVFELCRGAGKAVSDGVIDAGIGRYNDNKQAVQNEVNQTLGNAVREIGPVLEQSLQRVINGQVVGVGTLPQGNRPGDQVSGVQGQSRSTARGVGAQQGGLAAQAAHTTGYHLVSGALDALLPKWVRDKK